MIAALGRAFAVAFLAWATALCIGSFDSAWHMPLGVSLFFVLLPVSILVHELGHALATFFVRWKVIIFSVGWIAYYAYHRQLLVTRRVKLDDAGGWVLAVPVERSLNTAERRAIFILGGPLASLLQVVVCFSVAALTAGQTGGSGYRYELAVAAFGAIGLAHFAATAIPMRSKNAGKKNDGAGLLALWRERDSEQLTFSLSLLPALLHYNVRLRDLPTWLFDLLREKAESTPELKNVLVTMEIGRMLDSKQVDRLLVRNEIDRYWREHEPTDWLRACDAYFAAVHENDVVRARDMVSQIGQPSTLPQMEYAAKAALNMLSGHRDVANEFLKHMDRAIAEASPYRNPTFRDIRAQIENLSS